MTVICRITAIVAGAAGAQQGGRTRAHRHRSLGIVQVNETDERSWPAPAKINLFLHILGRRPDGYHELQTCFQFVDLCDEITIACDPTATFGAAAGAAGVAPEADLCVRAAHALKAATGCLLGADIDVVKRIPMGAGLGGGSSDAATCLVALNKLWGLGLKVVELAAIGLKLGAMCRYSYMAVRPLQKG